MCVCTLTYTFWHLWSSSSTPVIQARSKFLQVCVCEELFEVPATLLVEQELGARLPGP